MNLLSTFLSMLFWSIIVILVSGHEMKSSAVEKSSFCYRMTFYSVVLEFLDASRIELLRSCASLMFFLFWFRA